MTDQTLIPPTVGRKVWFYPGDEEDWPAGVIRYPGEQPMDATVVFVHSDRMVNVAVLDHAGKPFALRSVTLVQPADAFDPRRHRVEWMPYQVGQARKI